MVILRQSVGNLADVVAFFQTWAPYAIPQRPPVPGLPLDWQGLGWCVQEREGDAWCAVVLKD